MSALRFRQRPRENLSRSGGPACNPCHGARCRRYVASLAELAKSDPNIATSPAVITAFLAEWRQEQEELT